MKLILFATILMTVIGVPAFGGQATDNPIEVGDVRWGRDLTAALEKSAETGKPVLVLFQEVPGCSGVRQFGGEVLTNPLVVQAIEDEFIPMLVYNNRSSGMDRQLLEQYREPAWNYQVIRFLDAEGKDVIPRKDRVWTTSGVAMRMIDALQAVDRAVPDYLRELAQAKSGE